MTRSEIVTCARSYLGTPFHHQGRLKGVGVDCVGLVVCVLRELGLSINDSFDYNGEPDAVLLRDKLREHLTEIDPCNALDGDILVFRIGRNPQHLGFVSEGVIASGAKQSRISGSPRLWLAMTNIIHTHMGVKKVVETSIGHWSEMVVAAFEVPGLRSPVSGLPTLEVSNG